MSSAGMNSRYLKGLEIPDCGAPVLRERHLEVWQLVEGGAGGGGRHRQLSVPAEAQAGHQQHQVPARHTWQQDVIMKKVYFFVYLC
jgi:hypothetical protein